MIAARVGAVVVVAVAAAVGEAITFPQLDQPLLQAHSILPHQAHQQLLQLPTGRHHPTLLFLLETARLPLGGT